jgi:hypothetical protein
VPAGAGADLAPRRRELDAVRDECPHVAVAGAQAHAHEPVGDDEIFDTPVRLEQRT